MVESRHVPSLPPLRLAGSYLAAGVVWIVVSDWFVTQVAETSAVAARMQTLKGWLFVFFSAAFIFALARVRESQLDISRRRLQRATNELQVLHRVFRHNIRNDLNVIKGYVDLVRREVSEDRFDDRLALVSTKAQEVIDVSEKLRVIDDATIGPIEAHRVDLVALIERECAYLRSKYPGATIETDLPETAVVPGDESLYYVFREIIENALEHHDEPPDGRTVAISLRRDRDRFTVTCSDDGPGIPRRELTALERGEDALVHVSGIGLWLVTWLCELFDAEVAFETDPASGTTVTMRFRPVHPLDRVTANGTAPVGRQEAPA